MGHSSEPLFLEFYYFTPGPAYYRHFNAENVAIAGSKINYLLQVVGCSLCPKSMQVGPDVFSELFDQHEKHC